MKRIILLLLLTLSLTALAQVKNNEDTLNDNRLQSHTTVKYQLFPTENMWTFIKLNTQNGQMWQVQFDVSDNNRFESDLSLIKLVDKEKEVNNRFTLYSTQNIYTFILLDQLDGGIWQVQWSLDPENRRVIRIE